MKDSNFGICISSALDILNKAILKEFNTQSILDTNLPRHLKASNSSCIAARLAWRNFCLWSLLDKDNGIVKYISGPDDMTRFKQVVALWENQETNFEIWNRLVLSFHAQIDAVGIPQVLAGLLDFSFVASMYAAQLGGILFPDALKFSSEDLKTFTANFVIATVKSHAEYLTGDENDKTVKSNYALKNFNQLVLFVADSVKDADSDSLSFSA